MKESIEITVYPRHTKLRRHLMFEVTGEYIDVARRYYKHHVDETAQYRLKIQKYYEPKTQPQLGFYFTICEKIANAVQSTKETIHASIKEVYGPRDKDHRGRLIPLSISQCDVVDMSRYIDGAILEANECGIDVLEELKQYKGWCAEHAEELREAYSSVGEYCKRRNSCDACAWYVGTHGHAAHIVSRGAGGIDHPRNILYLCGQCHLMIQHQNGWDALIKRYPHIQYKVRAAQGGKNDSTVGNSKNRAESKGEQAQFSY